MNWHIIAVIWRKEWLDSLRDRRTLISMIVLPVLAMPLLMVGMGALSMKVVTKARTEIPNIMVIGGEDSPTTVKKLKELKTIHIMPYSSDFTNQISEKKIRAAVEIPSGFDASLTNGNRKTVEIYVYGGEMKSSFGAAPLQTFFNQLKDEIVKSRLKEHQLPTDFIKPFDIETTNVASMKKVTGNIIGSIVPYMIILLCMTGAMYPAMDLTAGEKERGTIETLLCSPVGRINIVLAKFFTVLTASLATTLLSMGSMSVSFILAKRSLFGVANRMMPDFLTVDVFSLAVVFLMILPVAIFLSAAQLAIATFAKSFKEAQTYLSPLMIIVILPAVMGMLPGMEMNAKCAVIPILNTSLICKEILAGTYHIGYMSLIFGSSCLYATVALGVAVWLFNREDVLFRA